MASRATRWAAALILAAAVAGFSPSPATPQLAPPAVPRQEQPVSAAVADSLAIAWRLALRDAEWERAARLNQARRDSIYIEQLKKYYEQRMRDAARQWRVVVAASVLTAALAIGLAYAFNGAK